MEKEKFMLAVMSLAGNRSLSPVQVQKLFFLLDREISNSINGPYFDFQPYDYGPFDKEVYTKLGELENKELVDVIAPINSVRRYRLTTEGKEIGDKTFKELPENAQEYITKAVDFVSSLSFVDLVSAIYHKYPEMKVNSVFSS